MTVRLKILSIAFALLIVFGAVVGVSAILQRQVTSEIGSITRYDQPVAGLIADLDVITDEYELIPLRLLRRSDMTLSNIEVGKRHSDALASEMISDFRLSDGLIAAAIADEDMPVRDRLVLARLQGSLAYLQRKLDPFIAVGQSVLADLAAGQHDEASRHSLAFHDYEQAFGPDIAAVRRDVTELVADATADAHAKLTAIMLMSVSLFGLAAAAGLGIGTVVSGGVVRTLRRLVEGARAVEAGELTYNVPIRTKDEVGELAAAFNRMVDELRAKERIKDTFGKFLDPRIVAGLIEAAPEEADHAERRVVSVFFSDIEGFTPLSEQLTATALVNLLNHYFAAATRVIRANSGIVDKYIGDAIMAFWAPPFVAGDLHAEAACLAALTQQDAIEALQEELPNILGLRRNAPRFAVRMGIATGEVVVGTIGSELLKSFTVIGDTANLASRLEGVNKLYGTRIIVSDATLRLAQHAVEARELDLITVVGQSEPVRIHELLSPAGQLPPGLAELRQEFAAGLAAYRARHWDEAERQFTRCLEIKPGDGPSSVVIERIAPLRLEPPPADWDGVWRLTQK